MSAAILFIYHNVQLTHCLRFVFYITALAVSYNRIRKTAFSFVADSRIFVYDLHNYIGTVCTIFGHAIHHRVQML